MHARAIDGSVQLRAGAARRAPGDPGRVPDVRAGGEPEHGRVGDGPRPRQPHRAGGLLLHLQRLGPLPRGHEVRCRRGSAAPFTAASPTGPATAAAAATSELCGRVVEHTAPPRVAGGGADPIPRRDRPAHPCLVHRSAKTILALIGRVVVPYFYFGCGDG